MMFQPTPDVSSVTFAASKFIEVARAGLMLLDHSAKDASAAAAELAARQDERRSAASIADIVATTGKAHVAKWNAENREHFAGIVADLVSVSVQVACGALLQLSKQTVSIRHGAPPKWPRGRTIGSQPIRDVIWQGRNQAMHADEGKYSAKLLRVFAILEKDFGPRFHVSAGICTSRAREVVEILGWLDPQQFGTDLNAQLGE